MSRPSTMSSSALAAPNIILDREACIDAVLRLAQGIDEASAEHLFSAFAEDAVLDPTALLTALGVGQVPSQPSPQQQPPPPPAGPQPVSSRGNIVAHLMLSICAFDTMHELTNFRVNVRGDGTAYLTCNAVARHYRPGEGVQVFGNGKAGTARQSLVTGCRYRVDLVRENEAQWTIKRISMHCVWAEGTLPAAEVWSLMQKGSPRERGREFQGSVPNVEKELPQVPEPKGLDPKSVNGTGASAEGNTAGANGTSPPRPMMISRNSSPGSKQRVSRFIESGT